MFDSLDTGYIPICFIVVGAAWYIAMLRTLWIRIVLALVVPVAVSIGWYFIPRLPDLFRPLRPDQDPWVGWGVIFAATWSIVAVPLSVVSVVVFVLIRRRGQKQRGAR